MGLVNTPEIDKGIGMRRVFLDRDLIAAQEPYIVPRFPIASAYPLLRTQVQHGDNHVAYLRTAVTEHGRFIDMDDIDLVTRNVGRISVAVSTPDGCFSLSFWKALTLEALSPIDSARDYTLEAIALTHKALDLLKEIQPTH